MSNNDPSQDNVQTDPFDDRLKNHLHRKEARYVSIIARFCNESLMKLKRLSAQEVMGTMYKEATLEEIEECLELFTLAGGCTKYIFPGKPNEYMPTRKENYHYKKGAFS